MSGFRRRRKEEPAKRLVQVRISLDEYAELVGRAAAEDRTVASQLRRDVARANLAARFPCDDCLGTGTPRGLSRPARQEATKR